MPTQASVTAFDVTVPGALPPDVILFGRDERQRPHASRFRAVDADGAKAAAAVMGMNAVAADSEPLRDLAAKLPAGRLFASGKAFTPFASAKVFDLIVAASGIADVPRPAKAASKAAGAGPVAEVGQGSDSGRGGAGGAGGGPKAPADWPEINLGAIVLAPADDEDGWYAARVVATKVDDAFVLRWHGYSNAPEITRKRFELALMHPSHVASLG